MIDNTARWLLWPLELLPSLSVEAVSEWRAVMSEEWCCGIIKPFYKQHHISLSLSLSPLICDSVFFFLSSLLVVYTHTHTHIEKNLNKPTHTQPPGRWMCLLTSGGSLKLFSPGEQAADGTFKWKAPPISWTSPPYDDMLCAPALRVKWKDGCFFSFFLFCY